MHSKCIIWASEMLDCKKKTKILIVRFNVGNNSVCFHLDKVLGSAARGTGSSPADS